MIRQKEGVWISMEVVQNGFVVYGLGHGTDDCRYNGQPLKAFLQKDFERGMRSAKRILNSAWKALDKENPRNKKNRIHIQKILTIGHWAYALAVDLQPFQVNCMHGPTNPLRFYVLDRLEDVFTKCFAAAHMFGSPEQQIVGRRGLLNDFEWNGGIHQKTGVVGQGFTTSLLLYFNAYFWETHSRGRSYEAFGNLLDTLSEKIKAEYPKIHDHWAQHLSHLLEWEIGGFASKKTTSSAKTALIAKITELQQQFKTERKVA